MKEAASSSLPLVSRRTDAKSKKQLRRKKVKRAKLASQLSLRQHPCFRAFVGLITLQIFILLLVAVFVGDNFEQVIGGSRADTIRLIHDYYVEHFRHHLHDDAVPTGIVMDDDEEEDQSSKNPKTTAKSQPEVEGDDDLHELEDHIANQTEQILNQAEADQLDGEEEEEEDSSGESASAPPPIDNYYSRQTEYQKDRGEDEPFEFLVVGGSDGSGTRAFVTALGKLGVPMIVDDRGTMDIHGKPLFRGEGWPPLVQLVLNHTHSANYKVADLPQDVRDVIVRDLKKLKADLIHRGKRHDSKELRRLNTHHKVNHYDNKNLRRHMFKPHSAFHEQGKNRFLMEADEKDIENAAIDMKPPPLEVSASVSKSRHVQYGFKAPVTMLLLPFLREVFGPIKFLHVVRDGRDVALSANQSPVKKFYNSYYKQPGDPLVNVSLAQNDTNMNVYAMQLWNDWNSQVLAYEKDNVGKDFDFLVMRTEDLLNPETKFSSLQQLAHFVGSRNSLEELCCQSQQAVVDMGQSTSNIGGGKRGKKYHPLDDKHHIYDHLFKEMENVHHSDYRNYVQGKKLNNGDQTHGAILRHREDSEGYGQHKHGMGADPILSFIKGPAESDSKFDVEEGRHLNWHHGKMEAGSMLEEARERRAHFIQERHNRFRGIAQRVGALKKRQYGPVNPQKGLGSSPQKHLKPNQNGEPAQSFADRIAANHRARQQQHDPTQDMHRPYPNGRGDEQRRRLLSSFGNLQARHAPYGGKRKTPKEDAEDGNEKKHRQFKPHGNGKLLKEMPTEGGEDGNEREHGHFKPHGHGKLLQNRQPEDAEDGNERRHRQLKPHGHGKLLKEMRSESDSEHGRMEGSNVKEDPSSWSLGSLGKALGMSSTKPPNVFDEDMLEQFKHMPKLETDSGRTHRHFHPHQYKKNKKRGNVKERYGKWVSFLEDKPALSQQLHKLGTKSLETFGYEPSAPFLDTSEADNSFQCDSTVVCKGPREDDA
ncbi:expressed unknown protein [Seminavis robusta]|uniref:Uncharacterized protein n=1 Tax=Seminavis robusta TaxID=568900 RepID=A0A9N8DAT2_9STRA|nr:expressed unknown protein [Seminavis robusta]|eukprot:Sro18_g012770.1 n/a (985) ;mRNA; f:61747-64894